MRVLVLGLLAAASAEAGVLVQREVPFTASQLESALGARGVGEDGLELEVTRPSQGRLELVTPAGRWEIEIGAATGETAARIVALHVLELAWDGPIPPADPPSSPAPVVAAVPAATATAATAAPAATAATAATAAVTATATSVEVQTAAPRASRLHRYRIGVFGLGSQGLRADDFSMVGGALEITRTGRWISGGGVAWQRGLTIDRAPGEPIHADLIRARVLGGIAIGSTELVAGGFAGRAIVDGGTGALSGWLLGLAAEVRWVVPISRTWVVLAAAGAELFQHCIEVRLESVRLGSTARIAIGGGIGVAWTGRGDR